MSEWISVKDRLPEKDDWYIIYIPYQNECYEVSCDEWTGEKEGSWMRWDNLLVTHWMLLPDPPSEEPEHKASYGEVKF